MDQPFTLTVIRPGCEFSGEIEPRETHAQEQEKTTKAELEEQLRTWCENATISGYGDVRTQETKVDPSVRDAREFGAHEFSVSPGLTEQVQAMWAAHFYPAIVRAEPYKIHLYGPNGGFDVHRDTPETDLVGTFLVGLGDTKDRPTLYVGPERGFDTYYATRGSWVAFYPDEEHSVEKSPGYRAVIAFKLFRVASNSSNKDPTAALISAKIEGALRSVKTSFGLLLDRKYCIGMVEPSGFDAHILAAARSLPGTKVHLLPVLTRFLGKHDNDEYGDGDIEAVSTVYPLTQAHIDGLIAHLRGHPDEQPGEGEEERAKLDIALAGTEAQWLDRRKSWNLPFYSPNFEKSTVVWAQKTERGAEHTGNESRPDSEDSIYMSYAMVAIQSKKRKAPEVKEV